MSILKLKYISFWLFFTTFTSVVGILFISNFLLSYNITFPTYPFKDTLVIKTIECTSSNNYCREASILKKKSKNLDNCTKEYFIRHINYLDKRYDQDIFNMDFFKNNNFIGDKELKFFLSFDKRSGKNVIGEKLDASCILNYEFYKYYPYFEWIFISLSKLKESENFSQGHNEIVNPYIDGQVSISNIAKRFPTNYFFKTLLFSASVLMIFYWSLYNNIFNKILNKKKKNIFFYAGILSSFFLILHVFFLGLKLELIYYEKIRRLILILFIFFEVFAQINLTINLYKNKKNFTFYIDNFFLEFKKYFIILILIIVFIFLTIFILFNPGSQFNNIVEWNFFTILLLFYFLSYLMWKKKEI